MISNALAAAAKNAGLSDVQIAAEVGVSQMTVSRWMNGKSYPRGEHLMALRKLFPDFAAEIDGKAVA